MDKKTKHHERKEIQLPKNLTRNEEKIIKKTLNLIKTPLSRIMVPKLDMVTITADKKIKNLLKLFSEHSHSRIPVFSGTVDNIIGIFHIKDMMRVVCMGLDMKLDELPVVEFVRLPHFLYENINGLDAFLELQRQKVSMAIVVDEFGRTTGLVTIEDLLEEMVGEIVDEFDRESSAPLTKMSDNRYVVDPRIELEKFYELLGIEPTSINASTLAGLIYHVADRIPRLGEKIRFENWEFTILEGTSRKITKVMVDKKDRKK